MTRDDLCATLAAVFGADGAVTGEPAERHAERRAQIEALARDLAELTGQPARIHAPEDDQNYYRVELFTAAFDAEEVSDRFDITEEEIAAAGGTMSVLEVICGCVAPAAELVWHDFGLEDDCDLAVTRRAAGRDAIDRVVAAGWAVFDRSELEAVAPAAWRAPNGASDPPLLREFAFPGIYD